MSFNTLAGVNFEEEVLVESIFVEVCISLVIIQICNVVEVQGLTSAHLLCNNNYSVCGSVKGTLNSLTVLMHDFVTCSILPHAHYVMIFIFITLYIVKPGHLYCGIY